MKSFDQRWQSLTTRARAAPAEVAPALSSGFATRIVNRCRHMAPEAWEDIFSAFSLRAVMVASCLALIGGAGFLDWYDIRIERPKLEQTLTSELLPWP